MKSVVWWLLGETCHYFMLSLNPTQQIILTGNFNSIQFFKRSFLFSILICLFVFFALFLLFVRIGANNINVWKRFSIPASIQSLVSFDWQLLYIFIYLHLPSSQKKKKKKTAMKQQTLKLYIAGQICASPINRKAIY